MRSTFHRLLVLGILLGLLGSFGCGSDPAKQEPPVIKGREPPPKK